MEIGSKLKKIRENKRFSQQEIADILNISQRTYSNMESNKTKIGIAQLSKLSEILDFDLLELLQEQGLVLNQNNNEFKDNSNGIVINNLSEKLIDQYENRLKEKDEHIQLLKEKIKQLENKY